MSRNEFKAWLPDLCQAFYSMLNECDDPEMLTELHSQLHTFMKDIESKQVELDDPEAQRCPECGSCNTSPILNYADYRCGDCQEEWVPGE